MPDLTEDGGNYAKKDPDNNATTNTSLGHNDAISNHPQTGRTTSLPSCETASPSIPRLRLKNLDDIRINEEPNDVKVVTVYLNLKTSCFCLSLNFTADFDVAPDELRT